MRTTTTISIWIIRVTGIIQLILGILFWTGHAYTYVPVHMAIGSLLVLGLWTISGAFGDGTRRRSQQGHLRVAAGRHASIAARCGSSRGPRVMMPFLSGRLGTTLYDQST